MMRPANRSSFFKGSLPNLLSYWSNPRAIFAAHENPLIDINLLFTIGYGCFPKRPESALGKLVSAALFTSYRRQIVANLGFTSRPAWRCSRARWR
jgi:hypothetical protein